MAGALGGTTNLTGLSVGGGTGGPAGSACTWLSSGTVALSLQTVANATTSTQTVAYSNCTVGDAVLAVTPESVVSTSVAIGAGQVTSAGVITITLVNASATTAVVAAQTARVVIARF